MAGGKRRISYRSPADQARHIVGRGLALGTARHGNRGDGKIHSIGTANACRTGLTVFCSWLQKNRLGDLKSSNVATCCDYLFERSHKVGQKTLDRDRQAIQFLLHQSTGSDVVLPRIRSRTTGRDSLAKRSRAYTAEQLQLVAGNLSPRCALAARICYSSGLRAHELHTLSLRQLRAPSRHRTWSADRFAGRDGVIYTVVGKGGLVREVILDRDLSADLERRRLHQPTVVYDRGIRYSLQYDLVAGKSFSNAFSSASKDVLGWTNGAHGLRHGYAQQRMNELALEGFALQERLEIVSQELGHFRPDIVLSYLR